MRSTTLLAVVLPLVLAAPENQPKITSLKISGSGCPNNSGSVKAREGSLGDYANFEFTQLKGDSTENCEIHVQSSGGSQGWQVAVKEVGYDGHVTLKPGSSLDTFTQAFWSENAGNTAVLTGSLDCQGPEIKDYVTIRSSTNDLKWSKCTGADGNPGILNVNARPVVQGNAGTFDIKHAWWKLEWRKC